MPAAAAAPESGPSPEPEPAPSAPEPEALEKTIAQVETTTAAPALPVDETVAVEEAVEVQSFQPDATVPRPAEPEESGTVNLAPSFVGIPGRRLTDAELWSLLEPKDSPGEGDESAEQPENAETEKEPPDKPGS
jgi:hypothetical protein